MLSAGDLGATAPGGVAAAAGAHHPPRDRADIHPAGHHARATPPAAAAMSAQTDALAGTIASDAANNPGGSWTVMFYANGDNLNAEIYQNIIQLENIATVAPASVRIVVLYSQPTYLKSEGYKVYETQGGAQPWTKPDTTGTALLVPRPAAAKANLVYTRFNLTHSNVGSIGTLRNFIETSEAEYPAQDYALILSDHGGGIDGFNYDANFQGIEPRDASLNANKLVKALTEAERAGSRVDLLAFDECLMASTEVEYEVRDLVPYVVASEELVDGPGFDYETALACLTQTRTAVSPAQLAGAMIQSFQDQYGGRSLDADTLSAVATGELGALGEALRGFVRDTASATPADWAGMRLARADSVKFGGISPRFPFRDLGQFLAGVVQFEASPQLRQDAESALADLDKAVIFRTNDTRQVTGLSIVMPTPGQQVPARYADKAAPFLDATGWLHFLRRFATDGRGGSGADSVDWAEYNDQPGAATPLGMIYGTGIVVPDLTLPRGDVDWYQYQAASGGAAGTTIRLTGAPATANARMQLFLDTPAGLTPIASGRTVLTGVASLPGGTYFLEVAHASRPKSFAYALKIRTPDFPSPPPSPAGIDLGTVVNPGLVTIEAPSLVTKNRSFANVLQNRPDPGRSAWYEFETPRSIVPMKGSIEVLGGSARGREVTLYDQQGRPIRTVRGQSTVRVPYVASGDGESYEFSVKGGAGTYEIFFTGLS